MRYLFDTDICIEVIRRREPVLSRVKARSPDDLAVSAMSVAELRYGALNSSNPDGSTKLVEAFLAAPFEILAFGEGAAFHHAALRLALRAQPIGERDLVIAATARASGLIVVTHNEKHFRRVPGLDVEDWAIP